MEYLDQFKEYLFDNEKSECTIDSYACDINQFYEFYGKNIVHLNKQDVKKYMDYLHEKELSIKSINRKLVSLRQYIEFINDSYDTKLVVKIKPLKIEQQNFIDDMLDMNSVKRMVRAAEKRGDIRAVTIFFTLFYTGARVSEMLQIKLSDIDKETISIKGKGSKYRNLLIPKKLQQQWKEYSKVRINTAERLFTGTRGAITRQTVHNIIKKYIGQARGIDKSIAHAHSFRHLYSQSLGKLGVNQVIIAQLLGHSLNVTGTYMQVSKKELLDIINKLDFRPDKLNN